MNQVSNMLSQMLLSQSIFWTFLSVVEEQWTNGGFVLVLGSKPYHVLCDKFTDFLERCKSEVLEERVNVLISHVNEVLHKITEKMLQTAFCLTLLNTVTHFRFGRILENSIRV